MNKQHEEISVEYNGQVGSSEIVKAAYRNHLSRQITPSVELTLEVERCSEAEDLVRFLERSAKLNGGYIE